MLEKENTRIQWKVQNYIKIVIQLPTKLADRVSFPFRQPTKEEEPKYNYSREARGKVHRPYIPEKSNLTNSIIHVCSAESFFSSIADIIFCITCRTRVYVSVYVEKPGKNSLKY